MVGVVAGIASSEPYLSCKESRLTRMSVRRGEVAKICERESQLVRSSFRERSKGGEPRVEILLLGWTRAARRI